METVKLLAKTPYMMELTYVPEKLVAKIQIGIKLVHIANAIKVHSEMELLMARAYARIQP